MYIEAVPNRNSPPAILLRESYRENGKVRKRTLCNLSDWPAAYIEGLWCKRGGSFGYAGTLNREMSAMDKPESLKELFAGRHFDREVIILCVRWYLRFKLSLRDLAEMMAERGLSLAHTTIMRWVQHYTPEFEKRWRRYALAIGRSWRVDETYVKIRGE